MEQEVKIDVEETSINLGYVKKENENEEPEFQEKQYKISSNFENISEESSGQRNNGNSVIGFLDSDTIVKTGSVKLEDVKEENKDLVQETIEQSLCIELEIIQCHRCKVLFKGWDHLENHMLQCIDENYSRLYDNRLDIQRKPIEEIEKALGNGEISTALNNRSCSTLTETRHSKYADGISKTCKEGSFREKKHKCSECSYQSNHKKCLKLHILNQHSNANEKKYKCSECSYQTNYKSSLRCHYNIHYNSKSFECYICKKMVTSKKILKRHIMEIHSNTNEKKYKCSECSYQTDSKGNLKVHLNTHSNSKPFECNICKNRFTMKANLKRHIMNIHSKHIIKTHIEDNHSNTNEKKYQCSKCSYQTNHKGHLKTHLNMHNNIKAFECDICKQKFTQKGNLKGHIMTIHSDTNVKKYKCSECFFQTNHKRSIIAHKLRHKLHILNRHSNTN